MRWLVINGVRVKGNDVLFLVHQELGERKPASSRCSPDAQREIRERFKHFNHVIYEAKDMHNLEDYFGDPWTEGVQHETIQAKRRYAHALAYRGKLMHALDHVNRYLGGNISFISDEFASFVGLHVGPAVARERRLVGHSGRCFVVELTRFSTLAGKQKMRLKVQHACWCFGGMCLD